MPKEERRVRIVDIAEELGLSTATVSNVIHGKTKKISKETIRRVERLLEERNYIPSMAGILLGRNDSRIIGVMINNHKKYEGHVLEDTFIASSLNYLSAEIERAGYFMMVKVTEDIEEIIKFGSMWNLEGMVVIGFCEEDYMKVREFVHIPFVVYDGFFLSPERICNLSIDNYDGGYQVGKYFKEQGHQKVLCISDNKICMDLERYEGFRDGFGMPEADFMMIPMVQEERKEFYQSQLSKIREYTAIFAVSDYYAIDIMQFLNQHGVSIPEDICIVGFDDNPICNQVVPSLSSVRQDGEERAKLAISILKRLKSGEEEGTSMKLPVKLVCRQSSRRMD